MFQSVPAGCLYFPSYEVFKKHLGSVSPGHQPLVINYVLCIAFACFGDLLFRVVSSGLAVAGFLAEVVSCVLWVPIDVRVEPSIRSFR